MRRPVFVFSMAMFFVGLPAAAHAGRLDDAYDAISEAMDAVRDSDRSCRHRAMRELRDLRYDIRSLQGGSNVRALRAVLRAARNLRGEVDDRCPPSVTRALRRSTAALGDALDRWERRSSDEPARYHHGRHGHQPRRAAVDCWSASDPGCRRTKNGYAPMDRAAFASFLQLVRSASPHIFPMRDRVQSGIQSRYLTSMQLATLLDSFRPHVFPMLEVVKICAPRLVDPQNGAGLIAARFSPHTMVGSDAAAVVSAQRAD